MMSSSASSIFRCRSATSADRAVAGEVTACVPSSQIISWIYLFDSLIAPLGKPIRVSGATFYTQEYFVNKTQSKTLQYKPRSLLAGS